MRVLIRAALTAGIATVVAAALAGPANAAAPRHEGRDNHDGHAVFVQTDNTAGNQVVAYDRSRQGTLTLAGTYNTGGLGGVLTGSVVDHLASQGSLTLDNRNHELYAVNAGSNTVSVFTVDGDRLHLRQVIGSGGTFPVSVTVNDDLVYVLNARNGGSIQGYLNLFGHLFQIGTWNRPLGLDPTATPEFTHTPGQIAFSPNGSQLVVTTKANTNAVDVFSIGRFGDPSTVPVADVSAGTVPFGVTFDRAGHLVVTQTGLNALATFTLKHDGTISAISSVPTGQQATCWVTPAGAFIYTGNAGSADLSGFRPSFSGSLTLLGTTSTDPGTVDGSATPDGRYLYAQTGANGIVDEYAVNGNGSLTSLGSVTVANAVGGEGIVAS
jgi:6-phosphogluconolactonase (cycloisomerase 2 family)